jgi:hypothetical protein
MDYKIANQFLYTCDKYGNLGRKICDNVCFGTYDNGQNLFLVTKFDGKVETRDVGGKSFERFVMELLKQVFTH